MGGQVVLAKAEVRHAGRVPRPGSRETSAVAATAATPGASSMDVGAVVI